MKSETAKIIWILISITLFLIVVVGTTLLTFSTKSDTNDIPTIADRGNSEIIQPNNIDKNSSSNPLIDPIDNQDSSEILDIDKTDLPEDNDLSQNNDSQENSDKISLNNSKKDDPSFDISKSSQERQKATVATTTKPNKVVHNTSKKTDTTPKKVTQKVVKKAKTISIKNYWIQVGSYSQNSGAESAKKDLQKKGFQSIVTTKTINEKIFYRLRIGPFDSNSEASHYLNKVKNIKAYADCYINQTITKKTITQ